MHVFFHTHADDIQALPEALADRVHLLPDIIGRSRAASTDRKYIGAFSRFYKWAIANGMRSRDILPAMVSTGAIYLASLIQSSNSPSSVTPAFYGIKWVHDLYGIVSPTSSNLVVNVLEATKRILSTQPIRKEPITADILTSLYLRVYEENNLKK